MDETPEELEQIRRDAEKIDVNKYRKRRRALIAIGVGAFSAGMVSLVMYAADSARNPCERLRNHYCGENGKSLQCQTYDGLTKDSTDEASPMMRSSIRQQCLTKIERLKIDDNITVR